MGGDSKEKEQTDDVANSESEKKNSGGEKKATVPIAKMQAKRKKSDEAQKAVIVN